MHTGICYIVGAGSIGTQLFAPKETDFVVAADAGYLHLQAHGITADLVIGDFDSMPCPQGVPVKRLEPVKNETDMYAAVQEGLQRGYSRFHIYGGLGGKRLSHTLANIQTMVDLTQKNQEAYLFGESETLTAITNGSYHFAKDMRGYLSVFSYSDCCTGVSETGLAYCLDRVELKNTFPLGVSNAFIAKESCVTVENGTLLLLWGEAETIVAGNEELSTCNLKPSTNPAQ